MRIAQSDRIEIALNYEKGNCAGDKVARKKRLECFIKNLNHPIIPNADRLHFATMSYI